MKINQWKEVMNYSKEELLARLADTEKKLFALKMKHDIAPPKNPLEIRTLRRDVARFKSLLSTKHTVKKQ